VNLKEESKDLKAEWFDLTMQENYTQQRKAEIMQKLQKIQSLRAKTKAPANREKDDDLITAEDGPNEQII
jgi:hypothetical protein